MAFEDNSKIGAPLRFDLPELRTDSTEQKIQDLHHSINIKRKDGGMESFLTTNFKGPMSIKMLCAK